MLSIANITSKHASNYYSNGDYYTKDTVIGEWYGKIAERLNLNNKPFEKTDFENILNLNGRAKIVDSVKLIVDSYEKLKAGSLNISENNKVKTTNDLNIKSNSNLNNSKDIESKGIKKDMGFEIEM